jgi:hypothetical protein
MSWRGRKRGRAPGLAQAPPTPGSRVERPAGVGGPGGGSQPRGPGLGTPRARHHLPPARPHCPAPAELDLLNDGVKRHVPPPAGSILVIPAGFSDQSQFCHHFKRLVGVTPGQFRTPARIA